MSDILNDDVSNTITELIFEMTNKRFKNVKEEHLKQLQQICGKSETRIKRIYTLLIDCMKKPHSEMRYNAFFIFDKFFKMYRCFRSLAVEDLKNVLNLTVGMHCDSKLPPPKAAAEELKRFFLKSIKEWVTEFGSVYFKLKLCYEFLLRKKQVDFEKLEIEDHASRRRREEEHLKKQKFEEEKLKILRNEIKELKSEMKNVQNSLESCLQMLVPTPEEFFIDQIDNSEAAVSTSKVEESSDAIKMIDGTAAIDTDHDTDGTPSSFRETGMLTGSFSLNINLPKNDESVKIIETEENAIIIENAKDYYKLLHKKYLNLVKSWIKNLTAYSASSKELKEVIDIKIGLENVVRKYENLSFEPAALVGDSSDTDCDDMEEVVLHTPTADEVLIARLEDQPPDEKPSTSKTVADCNEFKTNSLDQEKMERKKKLLHVAPRLPYDVDLYHWEEENLTTPMLHPVFAEGRNFWSATTIDDNAAIPVPEGVASLRTRTIEFAGKFEPVKWSCRFALPNGKLCPRQDRFKCPFHGIVVARDKAGKCVDPELAKKDLELQYKLSQMETQDPEILAQVKMATGIDLKITEKGKRKRKANDAELTDIKKEQNTVRTRLEKKLFKRSTVKKVASTLDNLDQKRFKDKFGDQFQYVHDTI